MDDDHDDDDDDVVVVVVVVGAKLLYVVFSCLRLVTESVDIHDLFPNRRIRSRI